ncbi:MAG: Gfo/Idh/MocA family oxidoreductase [bacterium]
MKTLKTAVVGVGHLGQHHLKWLNDLPESDLVGLYDTDQARADRFAREYGITAFESLEQLADAVDVASIVVPTTAHYDVATFLIERGVHCLIEKPVTATLDEAQHLLNLARRKKVKVTVGHIERFNPAVLAVREQKVRPSFIEAHRLAAFNPRGTDVAVVLDLMIHDIDLALSLIDSTITDIQASAVAVISQQTDIANARLTFKNGAVANLTASRISLHEMRKLRIFQKSGYFSLDLARRQADIYRLADDTEEAGGMRFPLGKSGRDILYIKKEDSGRDMLKTELETFLRSVADNIPVAVTLEQGTEALRVALEVERIGRESLARMTDSDKT